MDDDVFVERFVEPGVVSAATGDDDVGFVGACQVGCGGFEVVGVGVGVADDGADICDGFVVDDGFGEIAPHASRGYDFDGAFAARGGIAVACRRGGAFCFSR